MLESIAWDVEPHCSEGVQTTCILEKQLLCLDRVQLKFSRQKCETKAICFAGWILQQRQPAEVKSSTTRGHIWKYRTRISLREMRQS